MTVLLNLAFKSFSLDARQGSEEVSRALQEPAVWLGFHVFPANAPDISKPSPPRAFTEFLTHTINEQNKMIILFYDTMFEVFVVQQ